MPFLIAFVGWHNSGKTTVAVQVASQLRTRGYKVGVMKSTKEIGLAPERQNSDTSRYAQVGTARVALLAPDVVIIRGEDMGSMRQDPFDLAQVFFADMDFVLIEGCKHVQRLAKIEVLREGIPEPPIHTSVAGNQVLALVCDTPVSAPIPCFHSSDTVGIARFIEQLQKQYHADFACTLLVNGRECTLAPDLGQELRNLLARIATRHSNDRKITDTADKRHNVLALHCHIAIKNS